MCHLGTDRTDNDENRLCSHQREIGKNPELMVDYGLQHTVLLLKEENKLNSDNFLQNFIEKKNKTKQTIFLYLTIYTLLFYFYFRYIYSQLLDTLVT